MAGVPRNQIMDTVVNDWKPLVVALTVTPVQVLDPATYTGVTPFQVFMRSPAGTFLISDTQAGTYVEIDAATWFSLPCSNAANKLWAKASTGTVSLHVIVLGNK
jgi:hypothetical protein